MSFDDGSQQWTSSGAAALLGCERRLVDVRSTKSRQLDHAPAKSRSACGGHEHSFVLPLCKR
jgi:hypothetical protein